MAADAQNSGDACLEGDREFRQSDSNA
jgi:hypothetical protein